MQHKPGEHQQPLNVLQHKYRAEFKLFRVGISCARAQLPVFLLSFDDCLEVISSFSPASFYLFPWLVSPVSMCCCQSLCQGCFISGCQVKMSFFGRMLMPLSGPYQAIIPFFLLPEFLHWNELRERERITQLITAGVSLAPKTSV